jgi:hypothetical protein
MSINEKPSRNEDEYFVKQDAEAIKAYRARLDAERLATERKSHFMKCPKCGADLKEKRLGNVAVDTCPDCNGMWLDAGELDLVRQARASDQHGLVDDFFDLFRRK